MAVAATRAVRSVWLPVWSPLLVLPGAAIWLAHAWPAWAYMWLLAFAVYAGLKWLSFADFIREGRPGNSGRTLGYLFLWPGMDARAFLTDGRDVPEPRRREWLLAGSKTALGCGSVAAAAFLVDAQERIAGWLAGVGLVMMLHCGLFHLLSLGWRRAGVDAAPIMNRPLLAHSLSDYWGQRWNLAFRDLAHRFVFRPCVSKLGVAAATLAVFLASGIVHDLVISIPARGGYGWPTLYFLIQGAGILFQRSSWGKRLGLHHGGAGRVFCAAMVLAPITLLVHAPFIDGVMIPMLKAFH